jgi:hypothetical protein
MKGSRRISAAQRAAMTVRRDEKSAAKIAAYMRGQERIGKIIRADNDTFKAKRRAEDEASAAPAGVN